ncbi:GIY-YIG nuclease family protein [Streptomyces sp. NPDC005970]|uniref:GIY-YIG nuclease family protein n=1 Tax=Streptomyces sp. NPDC005970 TaxID=3156723 RepID=UPI0033ED759E
MHGDANLPTHFPIRLLQRDARTNDLLAPELGRADGAIGLRHLLYRFYDARQRPLYIGITTCSGIRLDSHRRKSQWWPLAEYIAVSAYPSDPAVKEAERAAIRHERPRFNKQAVRGPANAKIPLHGAAEAAAAVIFREAMPEFIAELAVLLAMPERFPQPAPPPRACPAPEESL